MSIVFVNIILHNVMKFLVKRWYHLLASSVALVHERTIPTERPPLVGEVSANFYGYMGVAWSVRRIPNGRNLGLLDRVDIIYILQKFTAYSVY
jgi:hypothetical protein